MYGAAILLISLASLFVSLYSLKISKMALDYTVKAYAREEKFSAVMTTNSLNSFKRPLKLCNLVTVEILNRSKYASSLKVDVHSSEICLHWDRGGNDHPKTCYKNLKLAKYVIAPNELYEQSFRIHVQSGNPSEARIILFVNDETYQEFTYRYISSVDTYNLQW